MRIAYIIEKLSDKGGMERILVDKMNYLAEHTAHEIVLFLLWHDDKPFAYPLSSEIRIVKLNAPFGMPLVGFPMLLWRFRKYIRRAHPDITIYTWVAGAFLACYGGWRGKSIFESHDSFLNMQHRGLIKKASEKVDCFVTLTDDDARNYVSAKCLKVIPNFTTIKAKQADYSSKHCLWIGRLAEKKNLPRMIRLWKQVSDSHPDWILDIVGEGPEKENITKLIEKTRMQKNIILHPASDNVVEYYSNSSIYLLTSRFEGLPMVLLEAQACGLPIVAFDCDFGPRQVITDSQNGFLIPYDEDSFFVNRLSELMKDTELRKRLGNGAVIASRKNQQPAIMSCWLKLFTTISKN